MQLFDHDARIMRAGRVKKLISKPEKSGPVFLHERAAEGLADRLDDITRSFPRVLIHGAGFGTFAEALAGKAGEEAMVQTESAAPFVDLAKSRAPGAETVITPEEEPAGTGFDLAISGMTLHRANDPVGLLAQLRMVLKPDGLLLAALFGGQTLMELRASMSEAEAEMEGGISPRVSPMGEIRDLGALMQRAGLAMPVADVDRFDVAYESPFHLMRDLRVMGEANPLAGRRRNFTRRATLLRAAEIYAEHYARPDGRVKATFEIVYLTGWAPAENQPKPLRPGSAKTRLADALGAVERPLGEKPSH